MTEAASLCIPQCSHKLLSKELFLLISRGSTVKDLDQRIESMGFRIGKAESGHDLLLGTLGKLRDLSEPPLSHL